jgi:hypothetical protein
MLICLGRSRGSADVNVDSRDLYRMSLDGDGASHMESNPQGQHEDDKEEQREGPRCKSFDRFHQSGCASGRGFGFRARRSTFLKKGGVVQIWRET